MIDLRLKTTVDLFATWVIGWTDRRRYEWRSEDGRHIFAVSRASQSQWRPDGRTRIDFDCSMSDNSGGLSISADLDHVYLTPLDDERILIEWDHQSGGPAVGFYVELLAAIAENWPEALPQILPDRQAPEDEPTETAGQVKATQALARPEWWPKTERKRSEWREVYGVIQDTQRDYQERFDNGDTEDSAVTVDELIEAVQGALGKAPRRRTMEHIIQAGDCGWLNEGG